MDPARRPEALGGAPPGAPSGLTSLLESLPHKRWRVSAAPAGRDRLGLCALVSVGEIPSKEAAGRVEIEFTVKQISLLNEIAATCVKGLVACPQARVEVKLRLWYRASS